MSSVDTRSESATGSPPVNAGEMSLEVVVVPVSEADPDWPDWYALSMVRERTGEELPR